MYSLMATSLPDSLPYPLSSLELFGLDFVTVPSLLQALQARGDCAVLGSLRALGFENGLMAAIGCLLLLECRKCDFRSCQEIAAV